MSICANITGQASINLRKLEEQQKIQRALKIENRILKQTRGINLTESFSPITKQIQEVNQSTKKLGGVIKVSNSEKEKKSRGCSW